MENSQQNPTEAMIKLQTLLQSREKQIASMAEMLADLNEKMNDALVKNHKMNIENKELHKKLDLKENILQQELKDKELIFSKLQTLERENERLNEKINILQGKAQHSPPPNHKTTKGKEKPTFIETSHGRVPANPKGNENSLPQDKKGNNHELSPVRVINSETFRKQDSSGSEKGDDDEDVLERIRRNLGVGDGSNA